jgi:hypothetical protein
MPVGGPDGATRLPSCGFSSVETLRTVDSVANSSVSSLIEPSTTGTRQLTRHEAYIVEHLEDMPQVRDWALGDWAQRG